MTRIAALRANHFGKNRNLYSIPGTRVHHNKQPTCVVENNKRRPSRTIESSTTTKETKRKKAGVAHYLHGVKPRVSRYLELLVLREGGVLVPLAFQAVQVRVDHPVTKTDARLYLMRKQHARSSRTSQWRVLGTDRLERKHGDINTELNKSDISSDDTNATATFTTTVFKASHRQHHQHHRHYHHHDPT